MTVAHLQELKVHLQKALALDIEDCLDQLDQYLLTSSSRYGDLILQLSRYNGIKREVNQGIVNRSQSEIAMNQIRAALLSFIEELEDEDINWQAVNQSPPQALPEKPKVDRHAHNGLSEIQVKGLMDERQILQEKLSYFRKQAAISSSADAQFELKQRIADIERQLQEIRAKLGE